MEALWQPPPFRSSLALMHSANCAKRRPTYEPDEARGRFSERRHCRSSPAGRRSLIDASSVWCSSVRSRHGMTGPARRAVAHERCGLRRAVLARWRRATVASTRFASPPIIVGQVDDLTIASVWRWDHPAHTTPDDSDVAEALATMNLGERKAIAQPALPRPLPIMAAKNQVPSINDRASAGLTTRS
jgi:hypothetical protein